MIDPPRLRELFMGLNDRITGYRVFAGDGAGGGWGGIFFLQIARHRGLSRRLSKQQNVVLMKYRDLSQKKIIILNGEIIKYALRRLNVG